VMDFTNISEIWQFQKKIISDNTRVKIFFFVVQSANFFSIHDLISGVSLFIPALDFLAVCTFLNFVELHYAMYDIDD
jgi:hypothetical protein